MAETSDGQTGIVELDAFMDVIAQQEEREPSSTAPYHDSEEGNSQAAWNNNHLPYRAWWDNLSWSTVLRHGCTTFVQVPDRFRGAVVTARRKVLQVLVLGRPMGSCCAVNTESCCAGNKASRTGIRGGYP